MTRVIHSPLPPAAIRMGLRTHTAPLRPQALSLRGSSYYCRWKKNGDFILFATTTWGKVAVCALFGHLEPEEEGSRITVQLGLWPWLTGLCIYLTLFTVFLLMMAAASGDGMLILTSAMACTVLAIFALCLRYGIRKESPKLLDLLHTVCGTD